MPADGDPAVLAQQSEVAETVLAALQRLPVSLRVPIVLRYYADLSERDIALAIGRRQGTVKSRLHEARRRLAEDPSMLTLARRRQSPTTSRGGLTVPLLDDETLAALLHETGDSFAVPPAGAADTLRRVRRGDDADRAEPEPAEEPASSLGAGGGTRAPARRSARTIRAHRLLSAAAALVVLLAIAGGAGFPSGNTTPHASVASRATYSRRATPPSSTRAATAAHSTARARSQRAGRARRRPAPRHEHAGCRAALVGESGTARHRRDRPTASPRRGRRSTSHDRADRIPRPHRAPRARCPPPWRS